MTEKTCTFQEGWLVQCPKGSCAKGYRRAGMWHSSLTRIQVITIGEKCDPNKGGLFLSPAPHKKAKVRLCYLIFVNTFALKLQVLEWTPLCRSPDLLQHFPGCCSGSTQSPRKLCSAHLPSCDMEMEVDRKWNYFQKKSFHDKTNWSSYGGGIKQLCEGNGELETALLRNASILYCVRLDHKTNPPGALTLQDADSQSLQVNTECSCAGIKRSETWCMADLMHGFATRVIFSWGNWVCLLQSTQHWRTVRPTLKNLLGKIFLSSVMLSFCGWMHF